MTVFFRAAGSVLQFETIVRTNLLAVRASNSFIVSQSVRASPFRFTVSHQLNFTQGMLIRRSISNLAASHLLHMEQRATRVKEVSVFQLWFPFHSARPVETGVASQSLGLSQSVLVTKSKPAKSNLSLSHTVSISKTKLMTVSQSLTMSGNAGGYKPDRCFTSITVTLGSGIPGDGRCP